MSRGFWHNRCDGAEDSLTDILSNCPYTTPVGAMRHLVIFQPIQLLMMALKAGCPSKPHLCCFSKYGRYTSFENRDMGQPVQTPVSGLLIPGRPGSVNSLLLPLRRLDPVPGSKSISQHQTSSPLVWQIKSQEKELNFDLLMSLPLLRHGGHHV